MMTRSALTRRTEEQLQVALKELKAYKDQCQTLLQERDDNEKEMLLVLQKNTQLKSELNSLSRDYEDSCKHNSELQSIVDSFDQCREEYEGTLKNSAVLQIKLNNAEEYIRKLEDQLDYHNYSQTQDLFKKLIPNVQLSVPCNDITTIDLTCDDTVPSLKMNSKKKLKKYIKIKKCVKKYSQLSKKNKNIMNKLTNSIKQNQILHNNLLDCNVVLEQTKCDYEADVSSLQLEISYLHDTLDSLTKKYELSQKEIQEHILAMDDLLEVTRYNEERVHSLLRLNGSSVQADHSVSMLKMSNICSTEKAHTESQSNIRLFSDELGQNLGTYLSRICKGQAVSNICMPGATYKDIVQRALTETYCPNTTLIILVGRRGKLNKYQMTVLLESLFKIENIKKLVLFTFPYIKMLPRTNKEENVCRYKLNSLLFNAVNNNCIVINDPQPQKCQVVDINNLSFKLSNMYLDKYLLSNFCKRQVASMLYNIFIFSQAKNLASTTTAFIEQDTNYSIHELEHVPNNHLN